MTPAGTAGGSPAYYLRIVERAGCPHIPVHSSRKLASMASIAASLKGPKNRFEATAVDGSRLESIL
ncbi:MAG TPA: hypothetical protein DCR55_14310 [Lentisphaeria bacterium]|nr:hypothetical protein [Lentisphaeria bacterium]